MADALTTPAACMAVGASGLALASCLSTIDMPALVGAFGGSFVFILWARDLVIWKRLGYLLAGWIGGYYAVVELLSRKLILTSGLAGFVSGLLCVVIAVSVLEAIDTGEVPKWIKLIPRAWEKFRKRDTQ